MKIKAIRVIVAAPGRNFVTMKIITDDGLFGIGDSTVNGREKAVVAYQAYLPVARAEDGTLWSW